LVLHGGRISIKSASIFHGVLDIHADYAVDVEFSEEPVVISGGGSTRTVAPAVSQYHSLVFVSWHDGAWMVVEVTDR